MRWLVLTIVLLTPGTAVAQGTSQAAAQCERLASMSLPNTTITAAQVVNAGAFVVPGSAISPESIRTSSRTCLFVCLQGYLNCETQKPFPVI